MWFQRRREIVETAPGDVAVPDPGVPDTRLSVAYRINEFITFIYTLAAILIVLRFVLLGWGGGGSGFYNFVMSWSAPPVHPFEGLFHNPSINGMQTFDLASIVALIVWGLVTSLVCHLVTLLLSPVRVRRIVTT
ncbi:MAG: YggT family protein [Candidatus Xenobia bacterium]